MKLGRLLQNLRVACPVCEEISRQAGGGLYAAAYRRYHRRDGHPDPHPECT